MPGLLEESAAGLARALLSHVRVVLQQLKDGEITLDEANDEVAAIRERINQLPLNHGRSN